MKMQDPDRVLNSTIKTEKTFKKLTIKDETTFKNSYLISKRLM